MGFTAWQALVQGERFFWYLSLGILVTIVAYPRLRAALRSLRLSPPTSPAEKSEPSPSLEIEYYSTADIYDVMAEVRRVRLTGKEPASNEAVMLSAMVKALGYIQGLVLDPGLLPTIRSLHAFLDSHAAFEKISGSEAQIRANRRQLAMALYSAADEAAQPSGLAALVIPGQVYPGTVFGADNPMVLWISSDAILEMQAAAAFGPQHRPAFFALKTRS